MACKSRFDLDVEYYYPDGEVVPRKEYIGRPPILSYLTRRYLIKAIRSGERICEYLLHGRVNEETIRETRETLRIMEDALALLVMEQKGRDSWLFMEENH